MLDEKTSAVGFVLTPRLGAKPLSRHFSSDNSSGITVVGSIPNPAEFSRGNNIFGSAFIAKKSGWDMCVVPGEYRAFLPTLQVILDEEYASGDGTQKTLLVRISRHTAALGEPHQPLHGWHKHLNEGQAKIYSVSDVLGTEYSLGNGSLHVPKARDAREFYENLSHHQASAAPEYSITRFNPDISHCTPTPLEEAKRRRTFLVTVAYEKEIPVGRFSMKLASDIVNPLIGFVKEDNPQRIQILRQWQDNAIQHLGETLKKPEGIVVLLNQTHATTIIEQIQMREPSQIPVVRRILDDHLGHVSPIAANAAASAYARSIRIKTEDPMRAIDTLYQTPGVSFAAPALT